MPDVVGVCKLCQKERPICKSHIIPELCYQGVYDPVKHHFIRVDSDHRRGYGYEQRGIRERLLCKDCEGRLSRLETSFRNFWFRDDVLPTSPRPGKKVVLDGFDYTDFKLFHLSILWKSSVSKEQPGFRAVSLGEYEEKLRRMLDTHDAGPADHYPILASLIVNDQGSVEHGFIKSPTAFEWRGSQAYRVYYAASEWIFIVTDRPDPNLTKKARDTPKPNGSMRLDVKHMRDTVGWQSMVNEERARKRVRKSFLGH